MNLFASNKRRDPEAVVMENWRRLALYAGFHHLPLRLVKVPNRSAVTRPPESAAPWWPCEFLLVSAGVPWSRRLDSGEGQAQELRRHGDRPDRRGVGGAGSRLHDHPVC